MRGNIIAMVIVFLILPVSGSSQSLGVDLAKSVDYNLSFGELQQNGTVTTAWTVHDAVDGETKYIDTGSTLKVSLHALELFEHPVLTDMYLVDVVFGADEITVFNDPNATYLWPNYFVYTDWDHINALNIPFEAEAASLTIEETETSWRKVFKSELEGPNRLSETYYESIHDKSNGVLQYFFLSTSISNSEGDVYLSSELELTQTEFTSDQEGFKIGLPEPLFIFACLVVIARKTGYSCRN